MRNKRSVYRYPLAVFELTKSQCSQIDIHGLYWNKQNHTILNPPKRIDKQKSNYLKSFKNTRLIVKNRFKCERSSVNNGKKFESTSTINLYEKAHLYIKCMDMG